ncbi:uncharacterized protein T551_00532 [Pneumocystis jirovecii RU7]|uniref:PNPLA domain-containing protein n=1 Tax=Pneumocystis jirovecii (strain RU7) TaxID=1408657 RepID=A0A0W4ZVP0_PNEJ7|nr:uncharacterized protein T551_00532 [Pneumocystis jirovecii RU7]KTW32442.1 hypothetical protein T551_00532 [Pneumocystis jirovecii RU7]
MILTEGKKEKDKDPIDASKILSDFYVNFCNINHIKDYEKYIHSSESSQKGEENVKEFDDWCPVHEYIQKHKKISQYKFRKGVDEKREGFVYYYLRWPLLLFVFGYLFILSYGFLELDLQLFFSYLFRRGQRQHLRKKLHEANSYDEWKLAASELDRFLGNDKWMEDPQFDYYDYQLINKVLKLLRTYRENDNVEALKGVLETCVRSNFGGIENPRLYSQTYFGTKYLVDGYVTEVEKCLKYLINSSKISMQNKLFFFEYLIKNYGHSALCLSGGAAFAYYHLGVVKALLDSKLLPNIITGTSGGALIASLVCTRTDEELMALLVPELSRKITACHEKTFVWLKRWWKTGARFDAVDCAIRCTWFTRGSTTFKEAYERTGRILNISVVPDDLHSPPKLVNYLTAPDTVIWSALIASAAVPGILNPVPLMSKSSDGRLVPYSFGNKWKDGSLRTDIPINSLHMYFDVTYSIVSQVNPHIKTWFFSARGAVGHPVSHRKGKGWRGGFLGSAIEQYLKHDMIKWLRVLRDLELMPRPLGQDWTHVFLQKFKGNITIWPKTLPSDFFYILSDPDETRLSRMILYGQKATFPKLQFISHRMKIENLIKYGRLQAQLHYTKENHSNNPFYIILDRSNDKIASAE